MEFLDVSFPTIEENLAFEEALLLEVEQSRPREILRLWDAQQVFVVLGRGSKIDVELDHGALAQSKIPVFRRISGGASVLAAPGCLFYAVLLSLEGRPHLRMLDQAHRFVLDRLVDALRPLQPEIRTAGTSDLVIGDRKVSGNSLRLTRDWLLYHGTLLLDMDLALISSYLRHPPREPDYRRSRTHASFLANLQLDRNQIAARLCHVWEANTAAFEVFASQELLDSMRELVGNKYSQASWNLQR